MITRFIGQTGEFHDAFGVERGNVDVQLRYELLNEELDEYLTAKTFVDKVDAIVDMLYVDCGTLDLHEVKFDSNYFTLSVEDDVYITTIISNLNNKYNNLDDVASVSILIHFILDLAVHNNIYDILPELFDEVHASNMSKLDDNGKPIINDGILDPNKPKGKILKSKNFFEPRLEAILKKYNKI